jgi:hypothetical protein
VPPLGFGLPVAGDWATPDTMRRTARPRRRPIIAFLSRPARRAGRRIRRRAEQLGYASLWSFQAYSASRYSGRLRITMATRSPGDSPKLSRRPAAAAAVRAANAPQHACTRSRPGHGDPRGDDRRGGYGRAEPAVRPALAPSRPTLLPRHEAALSMPTGRLR